MSGSDFLQIVRENYPMAEFVMLADEPDVDAAVIRAQTDVSDGGWASYRN